MDVSFPTHPLGAKARLLLSSVFGPYARDDEYGSRTINPMELYHNQVTRVQGPFSLRMFHRSFGLMLIQSNVNCPCTLLDFPSQERFIEEMQQSAYDIVGIGAIMPNVGKVARMCELIRQYQPHATIVIGGHVVNMPDIEKRVDADHIVKGDGVRWFRHFLGQDPDAPVNHPAVKSQFGCRSFGVSATNKKGETAATLIHSVGCPVGCNFCSTSAMFGGKGNSINFYETGDALFEVMNRLAEELNTNSFFVMDENFLLHKKRALRLLELMQENNKSWAIYVFSSARVLRSYSIEQLVGLGISWVWMGLEGRDSQYNKLAGVDTHALIREFESHGIRVLGSTIIGLENHRPEDIDDIIDWAVRHDTVFHQFMLYTPIPGTPFYQQIKDEGALLPEEELPPADVHGQYRFNYRHQHIPAGEETKLILKAFERDFELNGPSLLRMFHVTLLGYQRYKDHPDARVRERFRREAQNLQYAYAGATWATRQWYRNDARIRDKANSILRGIYALHGWKTRVVAPLLGLAAYVAMKREAKRLANGWTYEPETFYEKNEKAILLEQTREAPAASCPEELPWVAQQEVSATD